MVEIALCAKALDEYIAERCGWLKDRPEMYVGGSTPTYILAMCVGTFNGEGDVEKPQDLDVYTSDQESSVSFVNQRRAGLKDLKVDGCIIEAVVEKSGCKLQLTPAPTRDFVPEVLGLYNCDMVAVGYHPYSKKVFIHPRFVSALQRGEFTCNLHRANEPYSVRNRNAKLVRRAAAWYGMRVVFVDQQARPVPNAIGDTVPGTFGFTQHSAYNQNTQLMGKTPSSTFAAPHDVRCMVNVPSYLQIFHGLYHCVRCGEIKPKLLCEDCQKVVRSTTQPRIHAPPSVTVVGGIHGFGAVVSRVCLDAGCSVRATGRNVSGDLAALRSSRYDEFSYDLENEKVPDDLLDHVVGATDVLILNATKTLDGNEEIWNTTLAVFDNTLLMDRLRVNFRGYVAFAQQLIAARWKVGTDRHLTVVYVDANESKCSGKMTDGKHLELNVAKSAVKQMFYTNACVFAKLNMSIVCYDPDWMSYHGISLEEKASRSADLLPADISAMGLLYVATLPREITPFPISDRSVFDFIRAGK